MLSVRELVRSATLNAIASCVKGRISLHENGASGHRKVRMRFAHEKDDIISSRVPF